MKPIPDGWTRISASIYYDDAKAAIDWLCEAFGFEVRLIVEGGGQVAHSELVYGDGMFMVGSAGKSGQLTTARSPQSVGGANTQGLMVYVDDVEAHHAHAVKHGAKIFRELTVSDYGDEYWSDRSYGAIDIEGHHWWFSQRITTGNPEWSKVRNKRDQHEVK